MSQFNRATVGNAVPSRRAVIYCRVSSAGQEDNSSLETQEAACRGYAAERGWAVVAVHREVHSGGDLFGRPQLTALRAAVRHREVEVVVAYALDRLTRNQAHLGLILSEADHAGVAIELVTEQIEDTPEGRLLQSVRGFVAEVEKLKLIERTQRGSRARIAAGKPLAGPRPPYGYAWADADKARLVENPITAPVLRRIFGAVAGGSSARQVARTLTAEGIPTPTGKDVWTTQTLTRLLRHPVYVGNATALRTEYYRERGKRKARHRDPTEHVPLAGVAEPLVPRDVAAAAVARLPLNQTHAVRNNRQPEATLLRSGYARCGYCGCALIVSRIGGKPYYVCCRHDRYGCPRFGIATHILDAAAWERVERVLTRPEVVAGEVARLRVVDPTAADAAAIDRRLGEVARRQRNLMTRLADEDNQEVAALVLADVRVLTEQRRQLEAERDEMEAQRAVWERAQAQLNDLEEWCRGVAANVDLLGYQERRMALEALGAVVRVWRQDHDPRYEIALKLDVASRSAC